MPIAMLIQLPWRITAAIVPKLHSEVHDYVVCLFVYVFVVVLYLVCNFYWIFVQVQFRGCMLYPLLQLLLQVLVQKTHSILQDEVCSCIYSMAAVNFTFYHHEFLLKFVSNVEGLSAEQQKELLHNCKPVEVSEVAGGLQACGSK